MQPSLGHLRFTVDTLEDLQLANQVYEAFDGRDDFSLQELLVENERHPEWQDQVAQVHHKNLYDIDQRAPLAEALKPLDQEKSANETVEIPMRNADATLSCPLCASQNVRHFEKVESFGFPLNYLICQDCGFVFQDPQKFLTAGRQASRPLVATSALRQLPAPAAQQLRAN
jgi:transposase-like protein